jgi:type III secretory pathway component EscV
MPLAFIAIGAVFLIAAITGRVSDQNGNPGLVTLLKGDLTGTNNFFIWIVAIGAVGALGYIPGFKGLSVAMLTLILLVIFISNNKQASGGNGLFAQFQAALASTQKANTSQTNVAQDSALDAALNMFSPSTSSAPSLSAGITPIGLQGLI